MRKYCPVVLSLLLAISLLGAQSKKPKNIIILSGDGLPWASERNYTLGDLTKVAIYSVKNDKDGFILMIEGAQID